MTPLKIKNPLFGWYARYSFMLSMLLPKIFVLELPVFTVAKYNLGDGITDHVSLLGEVCIS